MKKIIEEKIDFPMKKLKKDEKSAQGGSAKSRKKESVKKRRKAKKRDKMERWSGMILFVILLLVGFLMWVAGEVKIAPDVTSGVATPTASQLGGPADNPADSQVGGQGRVVVE